VKNCKYNTKFEVIQTPIYTMTEAYIYTQPINQINNHRYLEIVSKTIYAFLQTVIK